MLFTQKETDKSTGKQKLKDLKQEFEEMNNEINEMTGSWLINNDEDNLKREVKMDCQFVKGMFGFFQYYVDDEIKGIKNVIEDKLKKIHNDIGYVEPTLSATEKTEKISSNSCLVDLHKWLITQNFYNKIF